jgi:hypothetical protein
MRMTSQILLVALALGAIPAIGKLVRAIVDLLITLLAGAFAVVVVVLAISAFLSHGKLI